MGITDHRKTWRFQVHGSSQECMAAFGRAFSEPGSGGLLAKAKWEVRRSGDRAVAIYRGRAGLVKGVTLLSQRASSEEAAAIGSEVTFTIEDAPAGQVTCAMWLSKGGTVLGFTADGRFFRPYMRSVEEQLRKVDPGLTVVKS